MGVLLLRLAGPMQSWGTQSRFTMRDTGLEPSKSGVVGLLCAALGRPRNQSVDDLAAVRMGVRVDFPGAVQMDYHTAGGGKLPGGRKYGVRKASGAAGETVLSNRYYLADADFLLGLQGDDDLLSRIQAALREPKWQLYLGRKSFVPGAPVYIPDGLRPDERLRGALTGYPWPRLDIDVPPERQHPRRLRMVLEDSEGYEVRMDQPYGMSFRERRFLPRRVVNCFVHVGPEDGKVPVRRDAEEDVDVLVTSGARTEGS